MIKRFDQVRLTTTKNVKYLNGPAGRTPNPHGTWSVIGNIGDDLLLAKDSTTIKIPYLDVIVVAEYKIDDLKEQTDGQKAKEETD